MPIFTPKTGKTDASDGAGNPCCPNCAEHYCDNGEPAQFGAFVEHLTPGSKSSNKHWHAGENEMLCVLTGGDTLLEGDCQSVIGPGTAATFKAGDPAGYFVENTSAQDASYLVIGTRSSGDVVSYPDNDRILHWDRSKQTRRWTDHAGNPASNPSVLGETPS